jgi:hypothetical protein
VSLVAIIFVAVYLAMDRFKDYQVSDFLNQKGQELLAQIDNQRKREVLQSEYNSFVNKVAEQEVNPEKVERFVSGMINLNQAKEKLNKDEFAHIFENNLAKAIQKDSMDAYDSKNNEKWQRLQRRLKDIVVFEQKVKEADLQQANIKNSYSFSYTIDDTLNIIINEELKDNLSKQAELGRELERLEKDKALKWQKENKVILEQQESLQQALKALEDVKAAVSAMVVNGDSVKVSISTYPADVEPPAAPKLPLPKNNDQ